jgi:YHS domain-containing protein
MNPEKGARLCPISGTEANPKFAWVIGGKRYAFCCPPCVEEFLRQAKTKPQSIQAPEKYVKR